MSLLLAVYTGVYVMIAVVGLASLPLLIIRGHGLIGIMVAFLWFVILVCWQGRPKCYEIKDNSLVIVRSFPFRNIAIPLANVHDVLAFKLSMGKTLRLWGMSGLFSDTCWCWNRKFGKFFAAITDGDKVVMLSNGRKYAISPKYPDEFIADLKRMIP